MKTSMATIRKEIEIEGSKAFVWDANSLCWRYSWLPGFVIDCKLEGDWRTVTFATGMVVRELIISVDGVLMILYAAISPPVPLFKIPTQYK